MLYNGIFLFFISIILSINGSSITVAPSSVSAPLYTLANFTCKGIGNTLSWTIGGNSLTDPSNQNREISVTTNNISVDIWSSVLTIRALPINDEISVGCTVISSNPHGYEQKGAILIVKGISPVAKLQLFLNGSLLSLIWFPPSFYSNDIPQGSITTYYVYIENQHGQLLYKDITNDTSYELYNLTVCDIYTATVIAHSGGYSSSNVTIQEEYNGDYYAMILPNYEVIFNEHNNSFDIQFQVIIVGYPRLCNSTLLGTTRNISQHNGTAHIRKDIICSLEDCQSVKVNYTVASVGPQLDYIFIANILDYFNKTKAKNVSYFTTYHVQGLTLQYYSDNGSVVVECRFAEKSTADGCHVIFRESSKGTVKSINMTKPIIEESTGYQYITLSVSGNYTVTAHDIVDGTIITNPSVVYPQVLEYILLLPSPTETAITTSTESNDIITILSPSIESIFPTSDITSTSFVATSLEPTSGTSTTNLSVVISITASSAVVIMIIIIVVAIIVKVIIYLKKRKWESEDTGLYPLKTITNNNEKKITESDGPISRSRQKQKSFKTIKSRVNSFMSTSNISLESQSNVMRQKHLIRKVFNKYKYRGRVRDSRLWQLAKEMAKSDLVPPELALKSPSFKHICNGFIEKMESCRDVEYHCRMFLKICSKFSGSHIAIVGRDIQRDLRSEGVIINI